MTEEIVKLIKPIEISAHLTALEAKRMDLVVDYLSDI